MNGNTNTVKLSSETFIPVVFLINDDILDEMEGKKNIGLIIRNPSWRMKKNL